MSIKAADIPWDPQKPTQVSSRDFRATGDQKYAITYWPAGIIFEVDRLRRDREGLTGELLVRVGESFNNAKVFDGTISIGDLNFSSVQARKTRSQLLKERSGTDDFDWFGLLEEFCLRVMRVERQGPSPVDLRLVPEDDAKESAETWDVNGIPVLQTHPMILFGDGSCVAGDTLLQGPGWAAPIAELAARGESIRVWTLTPTGRQATLTVGPPTLKGHAALLRFTMTSGRQVSVTRHHRFLTANGWQAAGGLVVGDVLAGSPHDAPLILAASTDCALQVSDSWVRQLIPHGDGHHSAYRASDSTDDYFVCSDRGGEQLLCETGSDRLYFPLQGGAPEHGHCDWRPDALGGVRARSRLCRLMGLAVGSDEPKVAAEEYCSAAWPSRRHFESIQGLGTSPVKFGTQPPKDESDQWEDAVTGALFLASEKDTIQSISYVGHKPFYDLTVPGFSNYLANGLWHHNSGKSYLAMYIAGSLAEMGVRVLYCDWEFSMSAHRTRFRRMFRPEPAGVFYVRCERPMREEADKIQRVIKEKDIGYVICDSVGYACDGRPEEAERANEYFRAVRSLKLGSLHLAHVTKNQNADEKPDGPIGSIFWRNGARSVWFIQAAKENPHGTLRFGLYHKKNNLGALLAPRAYTLTFSDKITSVTPAKVQDIDELAASLPIIDRMKRLLLAGPQNAKDIADELNITQGAVRATASRHGSIFIKVGKRYAVKTEGDLEF